MSNDLFILFMSIGSIYSLWQGLRQKNDNIINVSIKIRYLGVGIMLLALTVIMLVKEYST